MKNKNFLKNDLPTYFFAIKDKNTPTFAKFLMDLVIVYVISPLDFIPDTIPMMGIIDDILLFPSIAFIFSKIIPKKVWLESKKKAENLWFNKKEYKKYRNIVLIVLFIFLILILRNIFS